MIGWEREGRGGGKEKEEKDLKPSVRTSAMIRTGEAETSDEKQGGKQSTGRREREIYLNGLHGCLRERQIDSQTGERQRKTF